MQDFTHPLSFNCPARDDLCEFMHNLYAAEISRHMALRNTRHRVQWTKGLLRAFKLGQSRSRKLTPIEISWAVRFPRQLTQVVSPIVSEILGRKDRKSAIFRRFYSPVSFAALAGDVTVSGVFRILERGNPFPSPPLHSRPFLFFPFPPFLFPPFPPSPPSLPSPPFSSLPLEVGPLNSARGSGGAL